MFLVTILRVYILTEWAFRTPALSASKADMTEYTIDHAP